MDFKDLELYQYHIHGLIDVISQKKHFIWIVNIFILQSTSCDNKTTVTTADSTDSAVDSGQQSTYNI